jgi:hypothetical protein
MNLLPNTEKEALKKGLKLRSFILASFIITAVFVSGLVMLLPSYFLALGNLYKDTTDYSSGMESSTSTKQFLDLPKEIDSKLKLLQFSNNSVSVTDSISKIIDHLPANIKLNSISFVRDQTYKEKIGVIILTSGIAAERDSLVSYVNLLKESNFFSAVDMPVSSLTKNKNLPFSMSIFIENKK